MSQTAFHLVEASNGLIERDVALVVFVDAFEHIDHELFWVVAGALSDFGEDVSDVSLGE